MTSLETKQTKQKPKSPDCHVLAPDFCYLLASLQFFASTFLSQCRKRCKGESHLGRYFRDAVSFASSDHFSLLSLNIIIYQEKLFSCSDCVQKERKMSGWTCEKFSPLPRRTSSQRPQVHWPPTGEGRRCTLPKLSVGCLNFADLRSWKVLSEVFWLFTFRLKRAAFRTPD